MESNQTFEGMIYIKQGRIHSKSEGPDYYLQTIKEDFLLENADRNLWQPDYYLEFYNRKIVSVDGKIIRDDSNQMRIIKVNENGIKALQDYFPRKQ